MKLPTGFIQKYHDLLGDEATAFFASFSQPSLSGYRINPTKVGTVIDPHYQLNEPVDYCDSGFLGKVHGKSIDHTTGYIYSQEPSAMYVGEVVDPQEHERVLDLCAAPGGKSTHLVSKMHNTGLLVSNEIFKNRAKILAENLERWGAQNTVITNESPEKLEQQFPAFFDRILVDAPCSGEGMFRKDPSAMEYWHEDYSQECANRQRHILDSAMNMLKPGGTIVYSTCTFAPEEDEQIIAWLLEKYPQLSLVPVKKYPGMDDGQPQWADGNEQLADTVRLFPHHIKGEGHFIAKLVWSQTPDDNSTTAKIKPYKSVKLTKADQLLFQEFMQAILPNYQIRNLVRFGDQLFDMPNEMPSIDQMNIITPGIHLGTFKKKRFEPALGLALAIDTNQFSQTIEITIDQWHQYVHGDTLKLDTQLAKGWYLLTCRTHAVAFGKVVNQTLKNFYPKGLRF